MRTYFLFYLSLHLLSSLLCQAQRPITNTEFADLRSSFLEGYAALDVPGFRIGYVDNLEAIPDAASVARQVNFFRHLDRRLATFSPAGLSDADRLDHQLLVYETALQLHRLRLEQEWNNDRPDNVATGGLSTVPNGKAWYRYFLKRWVDRSVEPDSLFAFGMREIRQVKREMHAIATRNGRDSLTFAESLHAKERYLHSAEEVQAACEALHATLLRSLPDYFPGVTAIPPLAIAAGTDSRLAQTPGFYRDQTFFYNFFDRPFEKRQIGWLYTHEGLPGHHYERNYTRQLEGRSAIADLFWYSAYTEGWAAYIEEIGHLFGAYPTEYDRYSKWEWDLIRSLRVPMDIGLNYYGWTDAEALAFWQRYNPGLDDIARREIARMRRWPAQVITYKYGAEKFLAWQQAAAREKQFNWVNFHARVLQYGPLPLTILEKQLYPDTPQKSNANR